MKLVLRKYKYYILCPLFFFLGSLLTLQIVQNNEDCASEKLQKERYRYYRAANVVNPKLVVLIISAPSNFDRRNTARETWLKLKVYQNYFVHYFVLGSVGLSTDTMLHLSDEQSKYNDLLILPISDTYSSLSFKVLQSLQWIDEQIGFGLKFHYLLKCDDDSFVRLDLLANETKSMKARHLKRNYNATDNSIQSVNIQMNSYNKKELNVYWGYFNGNAKIKTQGKWKENNWILCNNYIPYAQGGGYIISRGLLTFLGNNAEDLVLYNSEDVSVGTWLAPVSNLIRIHDVRFDTEWISRGCLNSHLIYHKQTIEEMKQMYKNIQEQGVACIPETYKRKPYVYDWNVQPNKCCNRL